MNRIICLCIVSVSLAVSAPLMSRFDEIQAIEYLENYGYLPTSDDKIANLINEKEISDAIKDLQFNLHLNETGVLDLVTKNMIESPRCGVKDERRRSRHKRYSVKGPKWDKTHLTWSLNSNKHKSEIGKIRRDLHDAFAVWQKDSILTFQEINSLSADIILEFHRLNHNDGFDFTGPGNSLAHAFYPGSGIGGDVHFDDDETWIYGKYTEDKYGAGSSFFATAVHEIGHALGLAHSNKEESVMIFILFGGNNRYLELHEDDIAGIREIYGYSNNIDQRPTKERTTQRPTQERITQRPSQERNTHRPHRISTTRAPTQPIRPQVHREEKESEEKPDTCKSSYDAITMFRNELFIFKDQYMWRISQHGVMAGFPLPTRRMWDGLPADFKKIDAVYESPAGKIVFFLGKFFYSFDANRLEGSKRPLTELGLPNHISKIDAIFVWGFNGKTFIFSGLEYWKFDEETQKVEADYPRKIQKIWKNVRQFDTAFQKDGTTYFFQKNVYYKFDDSTMKLMTNKPRFSSHDFMKCPKTDEDFMALEYMQYSPASKVKLSGLAIISVLFSFLGIARNNINLFND